MIRSTTPSWPASSASCSRAAGDERDRALGELAAADDRGEHGVRVRRRGGAAQHDRVAGLQAQRGGVDGDVRPRLVDDRDRRRAARAPCARRARWGAGSRRSPRRPGRAAPRSSRTGAGDRGDPRRRRARAGPSARPSSPASRPPRGRARWPRGSRGARSSSASATRSSAASLAAELMRRELARGGLRGAADVGDGGGRDGHAQGARSRRARSSPGGPLPRSRAAAPRAPGPTCGPSRGAARPRSSCRSPCRSARRRPRGPRPRRRRRRTPSTSTIPTGSSDVPPSRSARAAPASTHSVPCDGLAYFSHSLKLEWRAGRGGKRVPAGSPAQRAPDHAGLEAGGDHGRDPGRGRHLGGHDLRAHPARAERRGRGADLERRPAPRGR